MSASTIPTLAAALLLSACGGDATGDLRAWMEQVDAGAKPAPFPAPAPGAFIASAYTGQGAPDPFSPNKLLAEAAGPGPRGAGPKPDPGRRREALENYPLDAISMVGTIEQRGVVHALLRIDRAVHLVVAGQHVGQNHGLITAITDDAVSIREMVQDAAGAWAARVSKLELRAGREDGK